jgi:opacity protein-like surface antigen
MRNLYLRTAFWAFAFTLLTLPAWAQDERLRLSIGTAATTGADDNLALTASVGYRFLERLSFEVDFTATESSGSDFVRPLGTVADFGDGAVRGGLVTRERLGPQGGLTDLMRGEVLDRIAIFPPVPSARGNVDIALITAGFRYELPVQGGRLRPYVGGGLGIARTSEEFAVVRPLLLPGAGGVGIGGESIVRTGVAGSAGAGASLRLFRGLFVDVDARYFRLDRDRNLARLGGGVSYRF